MRGVYTIYLWAMTLFTKQFKLENLDHHRHLLSDLCTLGLIINRSDIADLVAETPHCCPRITCRTFKELTLLHSATFCFLGGFFSVVVFMFVLCDLAARTFGRRVPSFGLAEASQVVDFRLLVYNFNEQHVLRRIILRRIPSWSRIGRKRNPIRIIFHQQSFLFQPWFLQDFFSLFGASRSMFTN